MHVVVRAAKNPYRADGVCKHACKQSSCDRNASRHTNRLSAWPAARSDSSTAAKSSERSSMFVAPAPGQTTCFSQLNDMQ